MSRYPTGSSGNAFKARSIRQRQMRVKRVALVYKKTRYEKFAVDTKNREFLSLESRRPTMLARHRLVHEENRGTIERVLAFLKGEGIFVSVYYLGDLTHTLDDVDLVISVGGDGTLLHASHHVKEIPVLGVNSSPRTSVGFFTCADADSFSEVFARLSADALGLSRLVRLRLSVNGEPVGIPVLNDVLFAHTNPAATSRYVIKLGDVEESHQSSGIWLSTAAGSTAAMRSAGGRVLPLASQEIQYLVRELYREAGREYKLVWGVVAEPIRMLSKSMSNSLYIDGHDLTVPLFIGDEVTIDNEAPTLNIYGLDSVRRQHYAVDAV